MATRADWIVIRDQIVADLKRGTRIGSYNTGDGASVTYRTLDEQIRALSKAQSMVDSLDPASGSLTLARFADL